MHGDGKGYEVEFVALDGETLAVVSVYPHQIRPVAPHTRQLVCVLRAYATDPNPSVGIPTRTHSPAGRA
ncbi:DUF4926 domain-containing protein [Rhodocaloribacter sp.]